MGLNKRKISVDVGGAITPSTTQWLMSNSSGDLYYSTNANASSFSKSSHSFGARLNDAVYDGTIWVAATSNANAGLYYTTDTTGLTGWTSTGATASEGFKRIIRTNDRWFAISNQRTELFTTTDLTASSGWSEVYDPAKNASGGLDYGNGFISSGARYSDSFSHYPTHYYNTTAYNFSSFSTRTLGTTNLSWGGGPAYNKDDDEWCWTVRNERVKFTDTNPSGTVRNESYISNFNTDLFQPIWTGTYYVLWGGSTYYAYTTSSTGSWTVNGTLGSNGVNSFAYNGTTYAASAGLTIKIQTNLASPHAWANASVSNGSGSYYHGLSPSVRTRHSQWSDLGAANQSWD